MAEGMSYLYVCVVCVCVYVVCVCVCVCVYVLNAGTMVATVYPRYRLRHSLCMINITVAIVSCVDARKMPKVTEDSEVCV